MQDFSDFHEWPAGAWKQQQYKTPDDPPGKDALKPAAQEPNAQKEIAVEDSHKRKEPSAEELPKRKRESPKSVPKLTAKRDKGSTAAGLF